MSPENVKTMDDKIRTHEEQLMFLLKKIDDQEKEIFFLKRELEKRSKKSFIIAKTNEPCFLCKFISNQEKFGKSDFFKLSKQHRRENQLFTLFDNINSFLMTMNLSFDNVSIIENKKTSSFKFSISKSQLSDSEANRIESVLYWKDKLLISDEAYRSFCLHLQLDLPSIYKLRVYRKRLNSSVQILKLNDYSYFVDIKKLIHQQIKLYIDSGAKIQSSNPNCLQSYDDPHDTIILKLSADGTLCGYANFVNITFTIINERQSCMTAAGNYRLGILNCQENYKDIKESFDHLISAKEEIQQSGLFYRNKHYKIMFKWGSD